MTSSASRSQSSAMSTRRSTLPLVSPFRHSASRDREWKWTSVVATVAFNASSSIQASISTRPSAASWTIAGTSPSSPYCGSTVTRRPRSWPGPEPGSGHRRLDRAIEWIRRWKIDAARTASAPPSRTAATKSAGPAAPPEAMTGTDTRSVIARSSSVSKPSPVPSRSIDVTSSSPAPSSAARWAHSTASSGVASRPPLT